MYFDLHLHPALKSFLTHPEADRRDDCWTTYRNCIDFVVGNIIDSQSSLEQLSHGRVRLAVANIYALEDGLNEIGVLRKLAPAISHLHRDVIKDLRVRDYFTRFSEEITHLENSLDIPGRPNVFKLISKAQDAEPDGYNLVLAIEGAHILKASAGEDPLPKLDALKNFRHRFLYLTPVHFTRNTYCTHAFAMKLINPRKVPKFLPSGTGLTEEGKRVFKRAYSDVGGERLLIDVKHMSLSSRQQFYDWKRADPALRDLPIIASHTGVTGISWKGDIRELYTKEKVLLPTLDQWAIRYRRPRGIALGDYTATFNPTSINLYDEDIREVVRSGGLIGVMMDQRQLGVARKLYEYFGRDDYNSLNRAATPNTYARAGTTAASVSFPSEKEEKQLVKKLTRHGHGELLNPLSGQPQLGNLRRTQRRHLLHLANNLLHIVRVGGPGAWRCVCIGSDYDGLVDAPNNCRNVTEYRELETHLYEIIHDLIREHGAAFEKTYHLGDVRTQLRWFCEENGTDFVRRWL